MIGLSPDIRLIWKAFRAMKVEVSQNLRFFKAPHVLRDYNFRVLDKATYELKLLEDLTSTINFEMDANGEKGHMMRSLEKILRKHVSFTENTNPLGRVECNK